MPNRMLRDWTNSDKVDKITAHAEAFFTRLIMKADDFGCFWADAKRLKANLYPLKSDSIRETDLLRWLAECQKAGLIVVYESDGKEYLQIIEFNQRLRIQKSKFPLPNDRNVRTDDGHLTDRCPPEVEVEVEEKEKRRHLQNVAELGLVVYNAEESILANLVQFERICVTTGKTKEYAKESLHKYHLYLEEKEQYPKGKKAVLAGFEKWLLNEKRFQSDPKITPINSESKQDIQTLIEQENARKLKELYEQD